MAKQCSCFARQKSFTKMQISLPGRSLQQFPLSYLIQSPATLLFRASFDVITGNALVMAPGAADTSEVTLAAGAAGEAEEDADADVQAP